MGDLGVARRPPAGCSGGFFPAILHGVQFSASRWPGSADSSTATQWASGIAPVKVLPDTENDRGPFEGVRICAFIANSRLFAVGDRVGAIGDYSCGKGWRPTRARATAPARIGGGPLVLN